MSNIQLSSRTDQWGTPKEIIDRVYCTFNSKIDLDPASSVKANETVKASRIITEEENGLETTWFDKSVPLNIFLNPPSGKVDGKGKTKLFWQKLVDYYELDLLNQAIFLGFSLEQLAILQDCSKSPLDFSICIPRKRIHFISLEGSKEKKQSPTHSNFICYIHTKYTDNRARFLECFSDLGKVCLL